jgi:hypothetical protein
VALCLLTAGLAFYLARDVRKWRWAAIVQIIVAAAAGSVALFKAPDGASQWIAGLAAAVTIATGLREAARAR